MCPGDVPDPVPGESQDGDAGGLFCDSLDKILNNNNANNINQFILDFF